VRIKDLYQKCIDEHWSQTRYVDSGWKAEVERYWKRHIAPTFAEMEVIEVGPQFVKAWHRSLALTPTTANRCLEVLGRIYTFGHEEALLTCVNPCRLVKSNREKQRNRYATAEELTALGKAFERHRVRYPREVAFCQTLALTGARPISIERVRRDELVVHGDIGILRFAGKSTETTGEEETVIVPPLALKTLQALPLREDGLLLGKVQYRRFWERLTREAGCPTLWVRDLRRTFATVGLSHGVEKGQIGQLLNHRSAQTTDRYAKLMPVAKINAARAIARVMGEMLGGRQ